jgi:hypothetical protein
MKQKISKACFIRRIFAVSNAINASIIGFPLGPTPGTPTGMQVLLLIIDTSFFPQTPGKWHYLVNRNFTPGICQFCLMVKFTLPFILYEVPIYTSILEISLHKSKVRATFHFSIKNYWQIFHCPKLR